MSDEVVEVKPEAPVVVAVVGEIPFAGCAVVKALTGAGIRVRVLCPDSDSAAGLSALEHQPLIEAVRGDLGSAEAIARTLEGTSGVCFVSPVTMDGRRYRADEHVDDVRRVLHAAETATVRKFVYHSSVGAAATAQSQALKDAAAAEDLIEKSHCENYLIRTGPLMGRDDQFLTQLTSASRSGSPAMTIWGYGSTLVQPLAVTDFSASIARIVQDTNGTLRKGVYNITGPETLSLLEIVDASLAQARRVKMKFHVPLFVLQLVALVAGKKFKERVALLFENLAVEKNEIPALLGSNVKLLSVRQIEESLRAG